MFEIQILNKGNYSEQHVVSLPQHELPSLKQSSVRVQSDTIWISVNNTTYAKLGLLLPATGWWDIYPLPPNVPAELADANKYGRISAWGFGRVIESTYSDVPVGSMIWGYLPIGTLPFDLTLKAGPSNREVIDTSPHRAGAMSLYNSYRVHLPAEVSALSKDMRGWTAALQVPFLTAWLFNRHAFAWDEKLLVPPSPQITSWTLNDANISDAVVVLLSASSKTAIAIAQQLREERPRSAQPAKIVAVTSPASHLFTQETGYYDLVVDYDKAIKSTNLAHTLSIDKSTKVSVFDCGARDNAYQAWYEALLPHAQSVQLVSIGTTPKTEPLEAIIGNFEKVGALNGHVLNTSDVAAGAYLKDNAWVDHFTTSFKEFLRKGGVPGLSLQWGEGMNDVRVVWSDVCEGRIDPTKIYVFQL